MCGIFVEPSKERVHNLINLAERLENFYKKPISEIHVESTQEIDVSEPKGEEIW